MRRLLSGATGLEFTLIVFLVVMAVGAAVIAVDRVPQAEERVASSPARPSLKRDSQAPSPTVISPMLRKAGRTATPPEEIKPVGAPAKTSGS